ncbi:YggN family protein [Shewanella sp. Isolate11]|uniref:YggN family protein n=1 Tax=Shewanella sp. Isolate11 TaxID=2908530 RepID=UPI001EFCA276|nr:YggN family protein [Shewanella sp. Isolate11]MCG9696015.1 YggN family protein [Shewanella sp. Isolate11]
MKKLTTSLGLNGTRLNVLGLTALGLTTLLSSNVWAGDKGNQISFGDDNQCQVSLNYDVAVEPRKLVISEAQKEVYRIEQGKLYVEGNEVELDSEQQQLVNQYAADVSKQLPEVIDLVHDAVDIASTAVSMALTPLLGDAAGAKIDAMMASLSERIDTVAYQHGDRFYLGATESSLEETFGKEFEQEMEQLVQSSIGSMMMSLGSEMMSGDGDSFEEKMQSFSAKMEKVGEDIETQIEQQADELDERANLLCDNFQQLAALEQQLHQQVPQLNKYPLMNLQQQQLK